MNKILLSMVFMACFVLNASAQFSNSNYERSELNHDGWNTIFVEWSPSDGNYNGFSIGYSHAFSLSERIPLFIEPAVEGQCFVQYRNADYGHVFASIKIPANVIYKINISNTNSSLMPFAGVYLRYNVWGNHNMFKHGNRFQVGGQAGLKAGFGNHFIVGASYGADFSDFKMKSVNVSMGVAF